MEDAGSFPTTSCPCSSVVLEVVIFALLPEDVTGGGRADQHYFLDANISRLLWSDMDDDSKGFIDFPTFCEKMVEHIISQDTSDSDEEEEEEDEEDAGKNATTSGEEPGPPPPPPADSFSARLARLSTVEFPVVDDPAPVVPPKASSDHGTEEGPGTEEERAGPAPPGQESTTVDAIFGALGDTPEMPTRQPKGPRTPGPPPTSRPSARASGIIKPPPSSRHGRESVVDWAKSIESKARITVVETTTPRRPVLDPLLSDMFDDAPAKPKARPSDSPRPSGGTPARSIPQPLATEQPPVARMSTSSTELALASKTAEEVANLKQSLLSQTELIQQILKRMEPEPPPTPGSMLVSAGPAGGPTGSMRVPAGRVVGGHVRSISGSNVEGTGGARGSFVRQEIAHGGGSMQMYSMSPTAMRTMSYHHGMLPAGAATASMRNTVGTSSMVSGKSGEGGHAPDKKEIKARTENFLNSASKTLVMRSIRQASDKEK